MEEPRITEKTSIEGIRKAVSQMQEIYPNDALIIVPEGLWKDAKTEFLDKVLEKVKEHHYLLSDKINSTDYGMFTVGIEQIIAEMKAEVEK